jgi:hypothetical protein
LPVEIDVIYKYRAPEVSLGDVTTIATTTLEADPNELLSVPHPVGETVILRRDDEEHSEAPKEYVVVARSPILSQIGDSGYTLSALWVVVPDPDS